MILELLPTIYENFNHLFPVKYNALRLGNVQICWLEQLNGCAKYGIFVDKNIRLIGQNL